jgi:hypothetical protein
MSNILLQSQNQQISFFFKGLVSELIKYKIKRRQVTKASHQTKKDLQKHTRRNRLSLGEQTWENIYCEQKRKK